MFSSSISSAMPKTPIALDNALDPGRHADLLRPRPDDAPRFDRRSGTGGCGTAMADKRLESRSAMGRPGERHGQGSHQGLRPEREGQGQGSRRQGARRREDEGRKAGPTRSPARSGTPSAASDTIRDAIATEVSRACGGRRTARRPSVSFLHAQLGRRACLASAARAGFAGECTPLAVAFRSSLAAAACAALLAGRADRDALSARGVLRRRLFLQRRARRLSSDLRHRLGHAGRSGRAGRGDRRGRAGHADHPPSSARSTIRSGPSMRRWCWRRSWSTARCASGPASRSSCRRS